MPYSIITVDNTAAVHARDVPPTDLHIVPIGFYVVAYFKKIIAVVKKCTYFSLKRS